MVGRDNWRWTGRWERAAQRHLPLDLPPLGGTVAMAKIQSEIIVAIIAAVVAVAVSRVARNPQLAVLAIAMLYLVARSVIARTFQEYQ
jgi:hypothetical protein